ncbi:aminotransferase class IV [Parasporobacterium paucivorans]|uniref:4-amino-4-deoxychorismate lyase n=1 Tax=Parasporobacterium paucivorans DSM 15970 TaxID=1122934 RepID=A0A1M6LK21_9FIRM|nr:aminotransferase class IV [Parasporobacterium paucivorans]SHJ71557.1 4-amino-4-deoxychorismate lyase [Parasporobacterium paucivorans DSM 15970]
MDIKLDEGYMFGLGLFETIAVKENRCEFLTEHMERMNKSLKYLGISKDVSSQEILEYVDKNPMKNGVLKVMASQENFIVIPRENTYTKEQYKKGFVLGFSEVARNETSPLTYMKTLNYGDNIMEKRRAKEKGWDEPVFLNTQGQICEGATTNLFFVKKGRIYTPPVSCGMLNGIIRNYVVDTYDVIEQIIYPEELDSFEEVFVTNSLLGVMPVCRLGSFLYTERSTAASLKVSDTLFEEGV